MYRHCKPMGPLIQHDYCDKRDKSREREREKENETKRIERTISDTPPFYF